MGARLMYQKVRRNWREISARLGEAAAAAKACKLEANRNSCGKTKRTRSLDRLIVLGSKSGDCVSPPDWTRRSTTREARQSQYNLAAMARPQVDEKRRRRRSGSMQRSE
eukprot:3712771-Pleurochrysis_carterae.AAC.1